MSKKKTNSSIKCNVDNCKHQDSAKCECELDEIEVVCSCDEDDCICPSDTACGSYECSEEEAEDGEDMEDESETDDE